MSEGSIGRDGFIFREFAGRTLPTGKKPSLKDGDTRAKDETLDFKDDCYKKPVLRV